MASLIHSSRSVESIWQVMVPAARIYLKNSYEIFDGSRAYFFIVVLSLAKYICFKNDGMTERRFYTHY